MAQNPDELFDVVDAQDRVVGRAPRREVHARQLWHRAVHIWVLDRGGRVFLQQRSLRKDMSPGLWDSSSSGHLDAGEDYDAAAVRELREELGLAVSAPGSPPDPAVPSLRRWLRLEACAETGWEFVWVYRTEADGPFTLDPDEISGGEWVAPRDLAARMAAHPERFCPALGLIWQRVAPTLFNDPAPLGP